MRAKGRVRGRFVALSGFKRMAGIPGGCYELLIVDRNGRPVSPLCEWYRLRKQPGPQGTRRTYLGFLQPFFAYLLAHDYSWNAAPELIRGYIKGFLLEDVACRVSHDTVLDGYRIELTGASPLSQSSLRVLLAAIRDFYAVMAEAALYPFANPMCSALLQRWKRERMKAIENVGAPDHAGIRGESWQETYAQPTAFFRQRRAELWKPDIALTSEQIQAQMQVDLDWMTRAATTQRDRLIFMILRETGARLSEVLTMTAGGYRKAKDPYQVYVTNKGSNGREEKLIRLTPSIEAFLVRYVRTERAKFDLYGRKRLSDLDDTDPIFLTRRHTSYNRDAFYHHWRRLFSARPPQKDGQVTLAQLSFTAHDIRHLRVTEWLTHIRKIESSERAQILRRCVQRRMAWRSPLTILCYDHSFTEREEEEAFDAFQRQIEQETRSCLPTRTISSTVKGEGKLQTSSHTAQQVLEDLAFWEDEP